MPDRTLIVTSDTGPEVGTIANPLNTLHAIATATASTNSAATTASRVVFPANTARRGFTAFNDATGDAFLKFGTGASAGSFTVKLAGGDLYEMPSPHYVGDISVAHSTGVGTLRATEIS